VASVEADFPRHNLAVTGPDESFKFQAPNPRQAPNFNGQRKKSPAVFLLEFDDWNFFGAWSLGLGTLPPPRAGKSGPLQERKQKEFVVAAAAAIFRALCRSQLLAAKRANQ